MTRLLDLERLRLLVATAANTEEQLTIVDRLLNQERKLAAKRARRRRNRGTKA